MAPRTAKLYAQCVQATRRDGDSTRIVVYVCYAVYVCVIMIFTCIRTRLGSRSRRVLLGLGWCVCEYVLTNGDEHVWNERCRSLCESVRVKCMRCCHEYGGLFIRILFVFCN